ncbi:hypothetical protein PHMEG_00010515 [Phytophthora megakarya]|uniref:Uncharacterized protein n=1 Tax=Phytophthora megakarya TaxID=4795 RepID=A0A225WDV5_9STRA|nr:hypothetical protein PHMEG_00010515 [Phytophthora megakarya]
MVNSSQSINAAGSNTNPTSSSSGMSTGTSVAHAIASLAHSGSTPLTLDPASQLRQQQINSAANNAAAVLTSVARLPVAPAPKKRSTKSKCSPGLRSGKWTPEEEAFTNMIIHFFKRGLLDVEDGTSLRWYLAKRLNCEAMRVTKKLKGNSSIGKQIFRAMENTPANRQSIRRAREELAVVEARFLESLNTGGVGPGSQHVTSAQLPSSLAVSVRGRKILPNMKLGDGHQALLAPMPITKSEDARLLLHFFSEAKDSSSEDEPEDEKNVDKKEKKKDKKEKSGSLSIDLSAKLGKKRPLSSVTSETKEDNAETPKASKSPKTEDAPSPQTKTVRVDNPLE